MIKNKCPTREEILEFIKSCAIPPKKRDIATAFHVRGYEARAQLKTILAGLKDADLYKPKRSDEKRLQGVFGIERITTEGEIRAHLVKAASFAPQSDPLPAFFVVTPSPLMPSLKHFDIGDQFYGECLTHDTVSPIRLIRQSDTEEDLMGVIIQRQGTFWFQPCDRHHKGLLAVSDSESVAAPLVSHYVMGRLDTDKSDLIHIVKDLGGIEAVSDVVTLRFQLPHIFPEDALNLTKPMKVPPLAGRRDVREVPLVTIDGRFARDFDDAVWAISDPDPKNPGGFQLMVAIADVDHYVKEGDALDQEAYKRGNSVYFPDKVIPMLPERLSNDLCSLRPHEDRACLGVDLWIDAEGDLLKYEFFKGLMCSKARLTYEEVEHVLDGGKSDLSPEIHDAVSNLKKAYEILLRAREKRDPLSIHVHEVEVHFNNDQTIRALENAPALKSHQLIEEFMVLANRAAARLIDKHRLKGVFRIHNSPSAEKVGEFKDFLKSLNIKAKGYFEKAADFNALAKKEEDPFTRGILYEMILRSQSKAIYSPENAGHYGLQLTDYCHFTSPIRRYADLVVHRALNQFLEGDKKKRDAGKTGRTVSEICTHISERERYAVSAEREVTDRLAASYFANLQDTPLGGYVSGISRIGLFITFDHVQITGLLPMEALTDDYYEERSRPLRLEGRRHRRIFKLGTRVNVKVTSVDIAKGRIRLGLTDAPEKKAPSFSPRAPRGHQAGKPTPGSQKPSGKKSFKKKG